MTSESLLPDRIEQRVMECLRLSGAVRDSELDALCESEPVHANAIRALAMLGEFTKEDTRAQPERVGPYRITGVLGEGGMGTVYLAEQEQPVRRRVGLKLIKLGMDSKRVIARFESERQSLARMEHSNIARVFDGGLSADGRPYFVMEFVDGEPITQFCEQHELSLRVRVELFRQVCAGVQHAHQKGVLHRDLKPSNILVTLEDGVPRPKIIDFGLARATDRQQVEATLLTLEGQMLGTPSYMSPEQADSTFADVDTRTDVYSLGVILYELLVGVLPFEVSTHRGVAAAEIQQRIRDEEPIKPSSRIASSTATASSQRLAWARDLRGDLDWIVMRCLEKDPNRRYSSAAALSEDLARHMNSEVVEARPPSRMYRLQKLVRRHRATFVAAAIVLVVLVGGVIGTGLGLISALDANEQLEEQRAIAVQKTADAEHSLGRANEVKNVLVEMLQFTNPLWAQGRDTELLRMVLDRTAARLSDGSIEDSLIRAELHSIVAEVYFNLATWDEARAHNRAVLDLAESDSGEPELTPTSRIAIEALRQLARIEFVTGDADRGLKRIERARAAARGTLDPGDPLAIEVDLRHAEIVALRDDAQGLGLARQVVTAARQDLGPDHPILVEALRLLGPLEHAAGNIELAHALMREAEDSLIRKEGAGSLAPQLVRASRIDMLEGEGRYDEALAVARGVHEGFSKIFGPNNPRTIRALGAVGLQLAGLGRDDEARPLLEQTHAIEQQVLGVDCACTTKIATTLAASYVALGQNDAAIAMYERILAGVKKRFGADDPTALEVIARLEVLYRESDREADAARLRESR